MDYMYVFYERLSWLFHSGHPHHVLKNFHDAFHCWVPYTIIGKGIDCTYLPENAGGIWVRAEVAGSFLEGTVGLGG